MQILEQDDGIRVLAPAKLNLYLDILGKRDDGFHEIETVMTAVDLYDSVRLERVPAGIEITSDVDWVPLGPENLAWRAAERALARLGGGVRIDLGKRIPAGAGLGGGSSDAAAVLVGLSHLHGVAFDPADWHDDAAALGSDVPFFLYGGTAVCRGRGELVEPLPGCSTMHYVLIETPYHCSTPAVYGALELKLTRDRETLILVREALLGADHRHLAKAVLNRLEAPAFHLHPGLRDLRDSIEERAGEPVFLTGSGSGLFLVAANHEEAHRIQSKLEAQFADTKAHALSSAS